MNIQRCPNCEAEIKAGTQVCPHCGYAFPFATDMLDAGRVLQKRYELVKLIHSGGMGYIYLAQDRRLDREVVVKQVRQPVKSDAHRKKLEEEALRMAQLSHPAVAMVFDHFVEADFYFLVVEYIKGQTLSEIFEKSGRSLEESQVINWMVQVCEVIGYLHNKGMVHRDISPDNIMLTDEGHIKLIDFGTLHDLSMLAGKKAGKEGKFGFTPKEQWDGNPIPQSDVFAIGATAYYLLTGYLQVSQACLRGENARPEDFNPVYPPITEERPDISGMVEAVLGKALSLGYADRFLNATELASALRKLVSGGTKEVHAKAHDVVEEIVSKSIGDSATVSRRRPRWLLPVIVGLGLLILVSVIITSGVLKPPQLAVLDSTVIFNELKPNETSTTRTRTISNKGGQVLSGEISFNQPWLHVDKTTIGIMPGESQDIKCWVDTHNMNYGSMEMGSFYIKTNGGNALIPVDVNITKVIFEDDFSNPSTGWSTLSDSDGNLQYIKGGYLITCNNSKFTIQGYNESIPEIADCVIEVAVTPTVLSSNTAICGVKFRRQDDDNQYNFVMCPSLQMWGLYQGIAKKSTALREIAISNDLVLKFPNSNSVKIICQNKTISLFLNDKSLGVYNGSLNSKGKITLYATYVDLSNSTYSLYSLPALKAKGEFIFDNFKVSVP